MRFVRESQLARLHLITVASLLSLTSCGKTGHLAEVTNTSGAAVMGRGGRSVAELPTAQQQQLAGKEGKRDIGDLDLRAPSCVQPTSTALPMTLRSIKA
jgi:hypothetical protein